MKSDRFIDLSKSIVRDYAYEHLDKQDNVGKIISMFMLYGMLMNWGTVKQ